MRYDKLFSLLLLCCCNYCWKIRMRPFTVCLNGVVKHLPSRDLMFAHLQKGFAKHWWQNKSIFFTFSCSWLLWKAFTLTVVFVVYFVCSHKMLCYYSHLQQFCNQHFDWTGSISRSLIQSVLPIQYLHKISVCWNPTVSTVSDHMIIAVTQC